MHRVQGVRNMLTAALPNPISTVVEADEYQGGK